MMSTFAPRWRKVMRDLWDNKSRTFTIVASIAVGVFAFGGLLTARSVSVRDYNQTYIDSNPADATYRLSPFDDDLVDSIAGLREVDDAQGRVVFTLELLQNSESVTTQFFVVDRYDPLRINQLIGTGVEAGGVWPPPRREVAVERTTAEVYRIAVGDTLTFEFEDGETKDLTVSSITHDINILPSRLAQTAYAYIDYETLEWLELPDDYTTLYTTVANNRLDIDHIEAVAQEVEERIELEGFTVISTDVPDTPQESPAAFILDAILLLLVSIGSFSLLLSGFLILNSVSALLTQQTKQIGIMKSIGGKTRQIAQIYVVLVSTYGLLALVFALPIGVIFGRLMTRFMSGLFNFNVMSFKVPPGVLIAQILIALFTPLIASVLPVVRSVRITTREAIYESESVKTSSQSLIDRVMANLKGLPRPIMLSLRNTFRKRARLVLTLVTLSFAGAMFIAVLGVRSAFNEELQAEVDAYGLDIQVEFGDEYRAPLLEREARRLPEVIDTEVWLTASGLRVYEDDTEGSELNITGIPPGSEYLERIPAEGRWLQPGDDTQRVIVITSDFFNQEEDLALGDSFTINIDGEEASWQIVGIIDGFGGPNAALAFVPYDALARNQNIRGFSNELAIKTATENEAVRLQIVDALDDQYKDRAINVTNIQTKDELANSITDGGPTILTDLMLGMTALVAIVGGLGLAGTMSLNVMERTREIGVLRGIGASNRSVLGIVLSEGLIIGLFSVLVGIFLSVPVGSGLGTGIGLAFGGEAIPYNITYSSALAWLILAVIIATISSILPARRAAKISVREALSYEG